MQNLVGNEVGLIHLIFSLLSVLFGTVVILGRKGTKTHKNYGYVYLIAITLTNVTAFMIYRLFGYFGPFHFAALMSLSTTYAGIIPAWRKRPVKAWKYFHFRFMYWSVIGLYMAFVAELLTRIPGTPFFGMVGLASAMVFLAGIYFLKKKEAAWKKVFGLS